MVPEENVDHLMILPQRQSTVHTKLRTLANFHVHSYRAALRYYRLDHFPNSFSEKQIEQGKALWNLMCPPQLSDPLPSKEKATIGRTGMVQSLLQPNSRGFFTWTQWDGRDWKTESLEVYFKDPSVQTAKKAKSNMLAVCVVFYVTQHVRE